MKLIKQSYEIIPQASGLEGIYKQIEKAGRTCYHPDTEVLTNSGWKKINTITNQDKVLSYCPENNSIIYDDPNIIEKDYNDDLIEINHLNIKFLVTKDHRVYQSIPNERNYSFITASQMAGIENIKYSKQCRFRIPKYFIDSKKDIITELPILKYSKYIKQGYKKPKLIEINIPCNEDFMVIIGAFISEGHTYHGEKYGSGSYCQITQDENSELYKNVIKALDSLQWKYKISHDPRKPNIKWIQFGTNQCWVEYFDILFGKGSKNKHLPDWFRTLPESFLNIIIHNLYLGDGSHNTTRNEKYLSTSKNLLDEIQEIFILLGKNGTVNYDECISQKCYFEESHRDSWIISRNKHINIIPYSGKVYCTSTKSGIICIRYKGKTCWCGNCYKSEDKITEDSAKKFVERMINSKHTAMLEHGTVYLKVLLNNELVLADAWGENNSVSAYSRYINNKYSKVDWTPGLQNIFTTEESEPGYAYITTNLRVLVENGWLDDLKYVCEPTEYHEKRVTIKFTTDQGVLREFTRHRVFSFAVESTRYCNYSKDKFGNEITYIIPNWCPNIKENDINSNGIVVTNNLDLFPSEIHFIQTLIGSEKSYFDLLSQGWAPQQARNVLPLATKCDMIMTGFVSDWKHFFDLRAVGTTGKPHPQAKELAEPLMEEFKTLNYI